MPRWVRAAFFSLLPMLLLGCDTPTIEWRAAEPFRVGSAGANAIAFDARHRVVAGGDDSARVSEFAGQCVTTLRVARDGERRYAVWWSVRSDSTADLVASTSTDGKRWMTPQRVDTTDVAHVGCARVPPSIAADAGSVHVAYAMAAREGPGIFASHSMDRGTMFHSPVAVVYGEHPGATAIAARGDDVVIAYEDPNTNPRRIGLAFSRSLGHVFELREVVSPPTGEASAPTVAIDDREIAVVWSQRSGGGTDSVASHFVRVGTFR